MHDYYAVSFKTVVFKETVFNCCKTLCLRKCRFLHSPAGRQTTPASLPSPGDAGEARNRPGLLAHGGGWAHFSWLTWRRAALAGQRSPAELTFFCPAPSTHLGPPLAKETTTAAHDSCLRPSCLSVLSFVHRG